MDEKQDSAQLQSVISWYIIYMVCTIYGTKQYFKWSHSVCYTHVAVCRCMIKICYFIVGSQLQCACCLPEACKALISDLQIMLYKQLTADMDRTKSWSSIHFWEKASGSTSRMHKTKSSSSKIHSDWIWSAYHSLRTSDTYVCNWECVTLKVDIQAPSVISFSTSEIIF